MTDIEIKKLVNELINPLNARLKKLEDAVNADKSKVVEKKIKPVANNPTDVLKEFDNPISEADYYARYPFVKEYQDIHGGTAWENYQSPGKADGRTWKKMNPDDFKVSELKINDSSK